MDAVLETFEPDCQIDWDGHGRRPTANEEIPSRGAHTMYLDAPGK